MEGVVGQPGVVLGVQEEEFGCVGHHAPILVHPGDAGRRVGLHQHKEQQEEPGVIHLLVAGICAQDLWLIWAANTGSEAGGGHRGQLGQGGSSPATAGADPWPALLSQFLQLLVPAGPVL